jgi:hypothetical protein
MPRASIQACSYSARGAGTGSRTTFTVRGRNRGHRPRLATSRPKSPFTRLMFTWRGRSVTLSQPVQQEGKTAISIVARGGALVGESVTGALAKGTCIVYARVSTEDQARNGYSLTDRVESCIAIGIQLEYERDQMIVLKDEGMSSEADYRLARH